MRLEVVIVAPEYHFAARLSDLLSRVEALSVSLLDGWYDNYQQQVASQFREPKSFTVSD